MFEQPLTPVADSLWLSSLVAALPVGVVLLLLGVLRRSATAAAVAGLATALTVAIAVWRMPPSLAAAT